jgi:predicted dehydrogenase
VASTTAALAGTLAAGGVHAAGNDTLKIGLVGCGGRGTGAALNALQADKNSKLTALADVFGDRLESSLKLLRKKGGDKVAVTPETCFTGFDSYQKLIDSGVDVVLLCTPPGFRPQHLEAAVKAGKHVFCEKPIAVDPVGVRSVIASAELAKQKNLCLVSGFCYRYDQAMRETVQRIHDGLVGTPVALQVSYNTGALWFRGNDPKWSDMEYQMRNWYYFTWISGDHIVEQHCHNLDKAAWVLKGEMPVACSGLGGRQVRTDKKWGNIFDHHSVVFEYASGVRVFSYCRQMPGCYDSVSDHILCSKGTAELMSHTINGAAKWRFQGEAPNMYDVEHNELFAAIRAGKVLNDGVAAAHSTLMSVMGRMATYTGQRVTWDFALKQSQLDLRPKHTDWATVDPSFSAISVPGVTKLV